MSGSEKKACGGSGSESSSHRTPLDTMKEPRETILYIPCIEPTKTHPDHLSVVDVDPQSSTYLQVIDRCDVSNVGDELHHSGWNTCGSCPSAHGLKRDKLIFPCLLSDRIYIFDTSEERKVKLHRTIEPEELHKHNVSSPHTSHCMDTGEIMISTMGDKNGNAKGAFVVLDAKKNFHIDRVIEDEKSKFGYDFWYQYKYNTMISSQWGAPKFFKNLERFFSDVKEGGYGNSLEVWTLKNPKMVDEINLGEKGMLPLEVRFLHDPDAAEGYVGCALSSTIFRFYRNDAGKWIVKDVANPEITIDAYDVENWSIGGADVGNMPGIITDILISLCDKYLFMSNWVHGDIRCYNIKDTAHPKLVSQVFIGGSLHDKSGVKVTKPSDFCPPKQLVVKGKVIQGGPQMLQLSKDGKRLFVTTSLFSVWDKAFYPKMVEEGSYLLKVDVDEGNMKIDDNFLVDFTHNGVTYLAHEIRYPGGDCTSDIYKSKHCHSS